MRTLTVILVLSACYLACDRDQPTETSAVPAASLLAWDDPGAGEQVARASVHAFSRSAPTSAADRIWRRLGTFRSSFLRHWRGAFDAPSTPESAEVLAALEELFVAVNGPGGFWRKTVTKEWLGCDDHPGGDTCRRLADINADLAPGDAILRKVESLDVRSAGRFLASNEAAIVAYLDSCVPSAPSASALSVTPIYRKHLRGALEGGFGDTRLSRLEL